MNPLPRDTIRPVTLSICLTERAVIKHVSHIYAELGIPACPDDHRRVLAVIRYLER